MSELEAVIRGYIAKYPSGETWRIASLAFCSERTVRRVKQKMREEEEIAFCNKINAIHQSYPKEATVNSPPIKTTALDTQIDGDHYKKLKIQPVEYIHANNIGFSEGSAIAYLTRWRDKGGVKDLEKAIHTIQLLIELEATWTKETV